MNELNTEQLDEMLERWQQAMEALQPILEALREAFQKTFLPFLEAIAAWWVSVKRQYLYQRLRKRHFPHWLAQFLSQHWPRRFLPTPQFNHDVGD